MFLNSADGTENSPEISVNSKQLSPHNTEIYSESKKILAFLNIYPTEFSCEF